jgi:hypothetical protein
MYIVEKYVHVNLTKLGLGYILGDFVRLWAVFSRQTSRHTAQRRQRARRHGGDAGPSVARQ